MENKVKNPAKLGKATFIMGYISFAFLLIGALFVVIAYIQTANASGGSLMGVGALIAIISHFIALAYGIMIIIYNKKIKATATKKVKGINLASGIGTLVAVVAMIILTVLVILKIDSNDANGDTTMGLASVALIVGIFAQIFVLLGAIANTVWMKKGAKKAAK